MLYSHPQLRLLLALAVLFLAGLGVREWRAGFPDAALRLERFDQEPAPPAATAESDRAPAGIPHASTSASRADPKTEPALSAPPPVDLDARPLDLNRATVAELARLPGVGPGLARRILEDRDRRGRFNSPEALGRIVGLGPKKLAALRELVTVGE